MAAILNYFQPDKDIMDIVTTTQTISALGIAVAAFVSAYSARQTLSMVRIMERSHELNSRPLISVSLEDRPESVNLVDLTITNGGNGLARDIKFKIIGDDINLNRDDIPARHLSDLRVISRGVKTLAPHSIRRYWLTSTKDHAEEVRRANIRLKLTYHNADKSKKYSDEFELDFTTLPESRASNDPLYKLAEESEDIAHQLSYMNHKVVAKQKAQLAKTQHKK